MFGMLTTDVVLPEGRWKIYIAKSIKFSPQASQLHSEVPFKCKLPISQLSHGKNVK
jgi:hypothetical protein